MIRDIEKAYRMIRKGKPPEYDVIDMSHPVWTLRDIFEYHPQGKDLKFWEDMLVKMRRCLR